MTSRGRPTDNRRLPHVDARSVRVDSYSAPAPEVSAVGRAIRKLRHRRGLTLGDLATAAGLSPSFLSLVERGRSTLALTSLFNVARSLDVDVADLLPGSQSRPPAHGGWEVTHDYAAGRTPMVVGDREYRFLSARIEHRVLEPLLVTVHPTVQPETPYRHEGEEFAWVVSGELVYIVDGREHPLRVGDCIHVVSSTLHAVRNDGEEPAQVVWVLSQPLVRDSLGELTARHEDRVRNSEPAIHEGE